MREKQGQVRGHSRCVRNRVRSAMRGIPSALETGQKSLNNTICSLIGLIADQR